VFDSILHHVNVQLERDTGFSGIVTLERCLKHMDCGSDVQADLLRNNKDAVQAEALRLTSVGAGRANRGTVMGIIGQPNCVGKLSNADVAEIAGAAISTVKSHKTKVKRGDMGVFGSSSKAPYVRRGIAQQEKVLSSPSLSLSLSLSLLCLSFYVSIPPLSTVMKSLIFNLV
jgi:hypothetical protein